MNADGVAGKSYSIYVVMAQTPTAETAHDVMNLVITKFNSTKKVITIFFGFANAVNTETTCSPISIKICKIYHITTIRKQIVRNTKIDNDINAPVCFYVSKGATLGSTMFLVHKLLMSDARDPKTK